MNNEKKTGTTREIPTHKHPDQQQPIKDPDLKPSENNPINPQDDEPISHTPKPEPHTPGYDDTEGLDKP